MYQIIKEKDRLWQTIRMCKVFPLFRKSILDFACLPQRLNPDAISLLLLVFTLFMSNPFVFAEENIVTGGVNEETTKDPLAEEMVPVEIQKRLNANRKIIDTVEDETIRSMVQVDDSQGRVKSIGLRHILMTRFDHVDILIPNAKFLEENVINWTLESETIRSDIAVGVDFSAPVDIVMDTLVQAALDHPNVFDEPVPEAFLENINCDNGYLRFNLYYWHEMDSPRDRLLFNSTLQVEIIKRLRAQGIELASPTQNIITHRGSVVS